MTCYKTFQSFFFNNDQLLPAAGQRYFYSSPAMHIIKKLPLITPDYDASINPDFDLLACIRTQLALVYALFSDVTQSN